MLPVTGPHLKATVLVLKGGEPLENDDGNTTVVAATTWRAG